MCSDFQSNNSCKDETFAVTAVFNQTVPIHREAYSSFILQFLVLVFVLGGLSVLRGDALRLVLGPLKRMLKIIARYANDPLADNDARKKAGLHHDDNSRDFETMRGQKADELGNYETEQLITAISKITDLLRKCWGVAGADIISSNLARGEGASLTNVVNPCIPGKNVYALFGFAAISGFDKHLRALGGEVMILINDVASVLHTEVYRWGFEDSGQCNKNLGSSFLMVYRIGDVKEVKEKLRKATNVVFSATDSQSDARSSFRESSTRRRKKYGLANVPQMGGAKLAASKLRRRLGRLVSANVVTLSLASLPGINAFTDRALIGMLKSFASMCRDRKLLAWKNDFRLGAGVGAFFVDMIFGMDAGWAVEGAVGSDYKIDATYLSPHVNMASRMMSACKQYGVTILLSQAVEELLSSAARSKLRHLDTVTVKGSTLKQRIFTYDARRLGVDYFLFDRTDEQADLDSDRYNSNIFNSDQDLISMRQHVSDKFYDLFAKGRDQYLEGNWPASIKTLSAAIDEMVQYSLDEGYYKYELEEIRSRIMDRGGLESEDEVLRSDLGDHPSQALINYMEREGGVAPRGW
eukprot:CAMPEP_0118715196 /NCGR_PEP_ID=MMETSP0800-20121206/26720_1 /TAXON_ID=210618 ORGANISM="Striatella unipunctata, Strain CCMP2910" /NCGR_SAMPLE_ID=MMETSP0800 /ASSEMBLY_ACC=CAM_ASM_000638 /LENGTH=580 /DNA_ID=CAMNT_0006621297 /DNA_START=822 /DNA_END=2561 /DNA_ORIENTATION=+